MLRLFHEIGFKIAVIKQTDLVDRLTHIHDSGKFDRVLTTGTMPRFRPSELGIGARDVAIGRIAVVVTHTVPNIIGPRPQFGQPPPTENFL